MHGGATRAPPPPWAGPGSTRDREQTSPWARLPRAWTSCDRPRHGPTLESALPSPRPRSLFRLVLISLHGHVPRGTVFNPAPADPALRDASALTPKSSPPAARGLFHEFGYPPPHSAPHPHSRPGGGSAGCHSFPSGPRNQQKENRRTGEANPVWDIPAPVNKRRFFRPPSPGAAGSAGGGLRGPGAPSGA